MTLILYHQPMMKRVALYDFDIVPSANDEEGDEEESISIDGRFQTKDPAIGSIVNYDESSEEEEESSE